MSLQDIAQKVEDGFKDLMLSRYVSVAALTWLLYDHALTFEKERTWIWSNKVTLTKVLFLINRYSTPIVMFAEIIQFSGRLQLSNDLCVIWLLFEALWQSLSALVAQFLLGLRMCAIWGSRPWTKAVLYTGCLICSAASLTSISIALANVARTYQYFPGFQICYTPEPLSSWLWAAFFLPIMAFDVIIFALTIWNVWVGRGEHIRRGSLVAMMWRDGAVYFVLIFASELACVVISATWGFSKTMIIKFLVWTIQNVVIAHMTLNLVEAVRRPDVEMVATSFINPSNRDLNGRPSLSTNRRSRRSGLPESTIEFNSNPGSPVLFSQPLTERSHSIHRTVPHSFEGTHPYTLSQKSMLGASNISLPIEKGWHDPDPMGSHWGEIYNSARGERIRAVAGPSRRVLAIEPFLNLDDSDVDGAVMSVGTGRSRLLTDADTRPSILSRDNVTALGYPPANIIHRGGTPGWTEVDPVIVHGVPPTTLVIPAVLSEDRHRLGVAAQRVGQVVHEDAESRRRRMTQLVEALTAPPTSPVSPTTRSPKRPGFI